MSQTEKVADTSGDVLADQIARLREVFPEVFVEGKIDFDKLRATLGSSVDSGPSRFSFTWAGKDDAIASPYNYAEPLKREVTAGKSR